MSWERIAIYIIVLAIVVFRIIWKRRRKKGCGPMYRLPKKPVQSIKDRKKNREGIRKRIKSQKGRDPKDLDLFKDFKEKKK